MSILDPTWQYTPACATDIRKSIERERQRLRNAALSRRQSEASEDYLPLLPAQRRVQRRIDQGGRGHE